MPLIELETIIHSDIELCFDLARSIDLHEISTADTNEKAVDYVETRGLIELNEYVTWQATHFGLRQRLTSKITAFQRPFHFRDEQLRGAFKSIVHDHYFEIKAGAVVMKDHFNYQSPFGIAGKLFDKLVLTAYLRNLLIRRNDIIKEFAETGRWKSVLNKL